MESNLKPMHPLTNVRSAIRAIQNGEVLPVTKIGESYFMFSDHDIELGAIVYTRFDKDKFPQESFSVRFGAHHSLHQVIANPLPRAKLEHIYHRELPEDVDVSITIGKVLYGYSSTN